MSRPYRDCAAVAASGSRARACGREQGDADRLAGCGLDAHIGEGAGVVAAIHAALV